MSQHMDALQRGNAIRVGIAKVKAEVVGAGDRSAHRAAQILRSPDEIEGAVRVTDLLLAINRFGVSRTARAFRDVGISPSRSVARIRELTDRERTVLADLLDAAARGESPIGWDRSGA